MTRVVRAPARQLVRLGGWPRQRLFALALIVYGVANWLILAAVEGNVGNLLRHRLMLDPVLLILGAAGLEWAWLRVRRAEPRLDLSRSQQSLVTTRGSHWGKSHVNTGFRCEH